MTDTLFDDSLPSLVKLLSEKAGKEFVETGAILRDASGRLTFVASRAPNSNDERETLGKALCEVLGAYARTNSPIDFAEDPGASQILSDPDRTPIRVNDTFCWLIDRRIVGTGWLDVPAGEQTNPPRIAFASLKGGVGRSTALVVSAMDLAHRNKNVLVVDLDLEAPGLGNLLLDERRVPELGVIDFLVEDGLGGIKDELLASFVGSSELTTGSGGRVDVLPALGRRSGKFPENVLPKLSRAMIEDVSAAGSVSVAKQISTMIERVSNRGQYDVVLIDSRAGLSELAAPAIIGLGAVVLLFGTAQKQTFEGYRALFAALQLLAQRDVALKKDTDWRMMFRPVYAKASLDSQVTKQFCDDFYELYSSHIYDEEDGAEEESDILRFSRADTTAPHWPLIIPFSQTFLDFDPSRIPDQLTQSFYEQVYRPFLNGLDTIIWGNQTTDG